MQSCDNSLVYIYIYINLFFSAVVLGFPAFGREAAWEMLSDLQAVVNIGILQLAGRLPSELGTPCICQLFSPFALILSEIFAVSAWFSLPRTSV